MLPEPSARLVDRFLTRLDRALPGVIDGFYIVGSLALGGFRVGRSDIDFVATTTGRLSPCALKALRTVHRWSYADGVLRTVTSPPRSWPLVCNGMFVRREDLASPPATVTAMASQSAGGFTVGAGFDVNPVTWWTLAHRGIAVRGPSPDGLAVHLDDADLRSWTAANLVSYWRPWAEAVAGGGIASWSIRLRNLHTHRLVASGVLSVARMHATISTGEVISKEQAGGYALDVFGARWHPILGDALAYWRGLAPPARRTSAVLRAETVAFVSEVVGLVGVE